MTFGDRLKMLREDHKLRQEDLANKINVHRATIGKYETNERSPDKETILQISELFGVTTDYLLGKKSQGSMFENAFKEIFLHENFRNYSVNSNELPSEALLLLKEFEEFLKFKYNDRKNKV